MNYRIRLSGVLLCFLTWSVSAQNDSSQTDVFDFPISEIELSSIQLQSDEQQLMLFEKDAHGRNTVFINGEPTVITFNNGIGWLDISPTPKGELLLFSTQNVPYQLYHVASLSDGSLRIRAIPLWMSILPPLIAILLALIFKEVLVSLFIGVWMGAFIAGGLRIESFYYVLLSIYEVVEKYVVEALTDKGHSSILVFSLLIGGMVAIISRNGGMAGVVQRLSAYANSPRRAQLITWLLGIAIFFDDYSNTLIVGNTMRSVTDKFKISREKLAYIVDSTAAPVVAIAFITTWIGAELGYIESGIRQLQDFDFGLTPYAIFIQSLKYSFYPVFTLLFILILIYSKREFGPMYQAERRARQATKAGRALQLEQSIQSNSFTPIKGAPFRWYNAFLPVMVVILVTIFGLIDTGFTNSYYSLLGADVPVGSQEWSTVWSALGTGDSNIAPSIFRKLGILIGNADSYIALLWASLSGVIVAFVLTILQKIMKLNGAVNSLFKGFEAMFPALLILILAWSLAATTDELHTATYLTSSLQDSLNPYWLPVIVFVLAVAISFSTGSSWSTMAILYPIVIPTTWAICTSQGLDPAICMQIFLNVTATVLAASVLGDHCSPISDTTILSSMASECNHIDHVRTQMPYALTVGAVSLIAGGVSTALGGGLLVCGTIFLLGIAVLILIVFWFGKPIENG